MGSLRYPLIMISVCLLTKNAASTLKNTLESVRSFYEVVLLDNGSNDATLELAKKYSNVKIFTSPFLGFGPLRNEVARLASNDWILSLDSDEILSPALIEELKALELDPQAIYSFPRHNYYNEKRIRGCGWDHQKVGRLYHRNKASFSPVQVHEKLEGPKWIELKSPILHTPYRSTAEFLSKMQNYSSLFAEEHKGKKSSSFFIALFHAAYAFFRSYILKKGLFCGQEGFIISLYNANTTFYKYLKLAEMNNTIYQK